MKKIMNFKRMREDEGGFTLIEMLVVIAIIGLLSSVVLVALGPSRNKAKDARIISDMNQARAIAETLFNNGTYAAMAPTDANFSTLNNDIKANNGNNAMVINGGGTAAYAAYALLNSGSFYCVDSTGKTNSGSNPGVAIVCPSN